MRTVKMNFTAIFRWVGCKNASAALTQKIRGYADLRIESKEQNKLKTEK